MVWRRVTENTLGGNYTWYDSAIEGVELHPLIYCVGNAFPARDGDNYWQHLGGLFDLGGAGGDPDWHIERYIDDNGKIMYWALSSTDISGLEPSTGDYEESLVKKYFARTMREYARVHPESQAKIQELIDRYQLEPDAKANSPVATAVNPQDQPKGFWRRWLGR